MTANSYPVPVEITRLAEQLRATRAARPPLAELQAAPAFDHPLHTLDTAALWREIGGKDAVVLGDGEDAGPKTRKRRLTLASITQQATRAGLTIVRVEFDASGRIVGVITGKPGAVSVDLDDTTIPDRSEWN